jgi:hypothetical protein
MAKFLNPEGNVETVALDGSLYASAAAAKLSPAAYLNATYKTDPSKYGTTADQMLASVGLAIPEAGTHEAHGRNQPSMFDIFQGRAGFDAAISNSGFASPIGSEARALFPIATLALADLELSKDFENDASLWDRMIGREIPVQGGIFVQPLLIDKTAGGPFQVRPQFRSQGSNPTVVALLTTAEKPYKIPSYSFAIEITEEAMQATTYDFVSATVTRVIRQQRALGVYEQINAVYSGDTDLNDGSLASLGFSTTTALLDPLAAPGTITRKAYLKFLSRNQRVARKNFLIMDHDTYYKLEAATGLPPVSSVQAGMPQLAMQTTVLNSPVGSVQVMLVDSAADGGPLPANTILALDSRNALVRATNLQANATMAEKYALRRVEAFAVESGQMVYRDYAQAFDVLTVS